MSLLRVFVILPRNLDATGWKERFAHGEVPDQSPYGYHFAEALGAKVTYSRTTPTPFGPLGFLDKAVKRLLGFDLRHAWMNRDLLHSKNFDVVWTHTEYEHLAIQALNLVLKKTGPPVIAQSVWLIDEWRRYWIPKKILYRYLLKNLTVATFHSPKNLAAAKQLQVAPRAELLLFGISLDSYPIQPPRQKFNSSRPIRVLSLGNDRHRDWTTLFDAVGGQSEFELRVGSTKWPSKLLATNVQVSAMSQEQIRSSYEWADCVVVPLKKNLHASGITAILEAVACGVTVIATQTGGLEAYFDDDAISYVEAGDAGALLSAVKSLANDPVQAVQFAANAQQQLVERELTTQGFAQRHVRLSERLIKDQATRPQSLLK